MARSKRIRVSKDFEEWLNDFQRDMEKHYGRFMTSAMASDELLQKLKKRKALRKK